LGTSSSTLVHRPDAATAAIPHCRQKPASSASQHKLKASDPQVLQHQFGTSERSSLTGRVAPRVSGSTEGRASLDYLDCV
ncbi:hypothetical protein STEG23_020179, partial [Scotinomys teguina]